MGPATGDIPMGVRAIFRKPLAAFSHQVPKHKVALRCLEILLPSLTHITQRAMILARRNGLSYDHGSDNWRLGSVSDVTLGVVA